MQITLEAAAVVWFHDRQLRERDWPVLSRMPVRSDAWHWIDVNHRYNGLRLREEARTRRFDLPPVEIEAGKRLIERYERKRGDAVTALEDALLDMLAGGGTPHPIPHPVPHPAADGAGVLIDRLSVLALQIHPLRKMSAQAGAGDPQLQACSARLERLLAQRSDLMLRFDAWLAQARAGAGRRCLASPPRHDAANREGLHAES